MVILCAMGLTRWRSYELLIPLKEAETCLVHLLLPHSLVLDQL